MTTTKDPWLILTTESVSANTETIRAAAEQIPWGNICTAIYWGDDDDPDDEWIHDDRPIVPRITLLAAIQTVLDRLDAETALAILRREPGIALGNFADRLSDEVVRDLALIAPFSSAIRVLDRLDDSTAETILRREPEIALIFHSDRLSDAAIQDLALIKPWVAASYVPGRLAPETIREILRRDPWVGLRLQAVGA